MIVDEVEFNEWLTGHNKEIYNEALNNLDEIITEQLDISDNQTECQTLRWVLDKISELIR